MDKIEGVNLATVIAEAEAALLAEDRKKVNHAINGMLSNIRAWEAEIRKAETLIGERKGKIAKAREKLERIGAGDWSLLSEPKAPGAPSETEDRRG